MGRPRDGSITEKNGVISVRLTFTNRDGKRQELRRRAENRTHAKRLLEELKEEANQILAGQVVPSQNEMKFEYLAGWYAETQAIDPVYADGHKVAGLRGKRTVLYRLRLLQAAFGSALLSSITYDQIKAYKLNRLQQRTPRGTPLKLQSVHRELALLRHLFQLAVQRGWLARNPFHGGAPLIEKARELGRERVLSPDEETRLLMYCRDEREHLYGVVVCAIDTGMRPGEIFSLQWSDVNLPKRLIQIQATNTKTLTARAVPISERLAQILRWRWQYRESENERVFGIEKSVAKGWKTACRLAEIENLRLYDLRHTFASRLTENGVSPFIVALLLGHTTPKMSYHYTHLTSKMAEQITSSLRLSEAQRIDRAQPQTTTTKNVAWSNS